MVDPLSALSVASAVVQFVDDDTKFVDKAREVAAKGSTIENDEIEKGTIQLRSLSKSVWQHSSSGSQQPSHPEQALNLMASDCCAAADELIALLGVLKLRGPKNLFKRITNSYKTGQKQEKISQLQGQLEGLQVQTNQQLLLVLRYSSLPPSQGMRSANDVCCIFRERPSKTLQQLDQLTYRGELLGPAITNELARIREDLMKILEGDLSDNDRLRYLLRGVVEESQKVEKEKILFSLKFESMKARHDRIKEAHEKTFACIFTDPESSIHPENIFMDRLRSGKGIFWVSGKAGSGKSTLMQYLCDHAKTVEALNYWAKITSTSPKISSDPATEGLEHQSKHETKAVVASRYFWSLGNSVQRSQERLLRTLLHDILRQCPNLIETVCPAKWNAHGVYRKVDEEWSFKELAETIDSLQSLSLLSHQKRVFSVSSLMVWTNTKLIIKRLSRSYNAWPLPWISRFAFRIVGGTFSKTRLGARCKCWSSKISLEKMFVNA